MPLTALDSNIPSEFTVAINGKRYGLDVSLLDWASLPLMAFRMDSGIEAGENTLSPLDLFRRTADDWSFGSGQIYFDNVKQAATNRFRFNTSKGLDPWTDGQISLLPDTVQSFASAATNQGCVIAGTRLYWFEGNNLWWTGDMTSKTAVTGLPASPIQTLATDGYTIYVGYGAAQTLYSTNVSISTGSQWSTVHQASLLGWVKGRLMGALNTNVYNFLDPTNKTDLTPAFLTTPQNWTWSAFGNGPGFIFVAGYAGTQSVIYRTTITSTGTNLGAMTIAGDVPTGEVVTALDLYEGVSILGTTKGIRLSFAGSGNIVPGPLVPTPNPVLCVEKQDRFIWYGMTNYDGSSTGLGRLDLENFTLPLKPAYASDLMASGQGTVTSVATFLGKRVFTVDGLGIYTESVNKVASGNFTTGKISFGLPDLKVFRFLEVRHQGLPAGASVSFTAVIDDGTPTASQSSNTTGGTGFFSPFTLDDGTGSSPTGDRIEFTITLSRATDPTKGPTFLRWSHRGLPNTRRGDQITLPIILREGVTTNSGGSVNLDPRVEFNALKAIERNVLPVTLQIGPDRYEAAIDSIGWVKGTLDTTRDYSFVQGTLNVVMRIFPSP